MNAHPRRTGATILTVAVAASMLAALGIRPASGDSATVHGSAVRPLVGVVGTTGEHDTQERDAGASMVTVGVAWSAAQPAPATWNTAYLAGMRARVVAARAHGLQVVLDPGIQYAPNWVTKLNKSAQFRDQYGDVFTGPMASGNHVANAVTNPPVRAVIGAYLHRLGLAIPGVLLLGVRTGGGPLGELRYPGPRYNGHTDCYWAYEPASQSRSPVKGWRPGTGTLEQARTFLSTYNRNLVDYGTWLTRVTTSAFHTRELVMLPGWGQRPGVADRVVQSRLTIPYDEFNEGLDWAHLVPALPDRAHVVLYTTYLDAPSVRATAQLEDPAHFIAHLAAPLHLKLGGENTGNGTQATLSTTLARARLLDYFVVGWMDENSLVANTAQPAGGPSFVDLHDAIQAQFGS